MTEKQQTDTPCCDVLEKLVVGWFITENNVKVLPFIAGNDGQKYRINHCPSCGTYITGIKLQIHKENKES